VQTNIYILLGLHSFNSLLITPKCLLGLGGRAPARPPSEYAPAVRRLILTKVGRAEQVRPQARQHQSLQYLGYGRQIGYRMVMENTLSLSLSVSTVTCKFC